MLKLGQIPQPVRDDFLLPVYRRCDIVMVRGEGVYLFDADGGRYLDFASGIAVNALGHGHPHVVAALKKQADSLWHCSNMYRNPGLETLAGRLTRATFADKVFFCSSGAEAVECGLKMIRKYQDAAGRPGRYRVITMEGGFHGRTLACISAGGNAVARLGYGPLMDGFDAVPFNDLAAAEAAISPETAAVLVEPIQGEGGIRMAAPEFLRGLRKLCDERGLLLFIDEVQSGMGRTGKLFAYEHAGITPDIASAAKGIGNGFPLAACLAGEKAAQAMTPGSHGSTYGGNPLAMAVANAVLDLIEADGFLERVEKMGKVLRAGLDKLAAAHPSVFELARGQGLIQGLKCNVPSGDMVVALRRAGLLTVGAGDNVVRFVPPLIIDESHVDEAIAIIDQVARGWVHKPPAEAAQ
jgi:acetylornithine/N-succinyldiaminopimelate aminotransferase